jgi:hypothetical protein
VLVIDDMVKTGGTLVECAKALKAGGCQRESKQMAGVGPHIRHTVYPCELLAPLGGSRLRKSSKEWSGSVWMQLGLHRFQRTWHMPLSLVTHTNASAVVVNPQRCACSHCRTMEASTRGLFSHDWSALQVTAASSSTSM